jgi:hypothetical protein
MTMQTTFISRRRRSASIRGFMSTLDVRLVAVAVTTALAALVWAWLPHALGGPAQTVEAAPSRGTVAGWVTFDTSVSFSTVTIAYEDGGRTRTRSTDVGDAITFNCAKYVPLVGLTFLTGSCFEFDDIPRGQEVRVTVEYEDGVRRTAEDRFSDWEPFNWMGHISYR